jgi:hypothetical protein
VILGGEIGFDEMPFGSVDVGATGADAGTSFSSSAGVVTKKEKERRESVYVSVNVSMCVGVYCEC